MADYQLLVFSWNDLFPGLTQSGTASSLVGQTFTFNGGGDIVTYRDTDQFSGSFGDHGFVTNQIIGNIDGVNVDNAQVNPEYTFTVQDSAGNTVGKIWAITPNNNNLSDVVAFTLDFEPTKGETYTLSRFNDTDATPYSNLYVCFASGTLIDTDRGPVKVEDIRPGDKVMTRNNGAQPVVWTGERRLSYQHLAFHGKTRPILIEAGALGAGSPSQPLVVSPQHRVVISSKIVKRMTGEDEMMIPAKKLLELDGVEQIVPDTGVIYHHVLCETHEVITANGALAETLFLGEQATEMLSPEHRQEIETRFPGLADRMEMHPLARSGLENRGKIEKLVSRHAANHKEIAESSAAAL